jgi:hypothetical protein
VNWREWLFETLQAATGVTAVVDADEVYGAGALQGSQAKHKTPFIVVRMDPSAPGPYPGSRTHRAAVYVHDRPGTYTRLDAALRAAEAALVGQVALPGAIACRWEGDSQDQADEALGTITRSSTYALQEAPT